MVRAAALQGPAIADVHVLQNNLKLQHVFLPQFYVVKKVDLLLIFKTSNV